MARDDAESRWSKAVQWPRKLVMPKMVLTKKHIEALSPVGEDLIFRKVCFCDASRFKMKQQIAEQYSINFYVQLQISEPVTMGMNLRLAQAVPK